MCHCIEDNGQVLQILKNAKIKGRSPGDVGVLNEKEGMKWNGIKKKK
jgi:hypothetical protein